MGTLGRSGARATSDRDRAQPPSARERAARDPFLIAADILKREADPSASPMPMWSSPPSSTSTGSTTGGFTPSSACDRQPSSKPSTLTRSRPRWPLPNNQSLYETRGGSARPASFGRWRHVNRFPSLGSPRTPPIPPRRHWEVPGGTKLPQPGRDSYSGRHPATPDNTSIGALENRRGRQALGGSNPSPSAKAH